jgi:hypothetical protein
MPNIIWFEDSEDFRCAGIDYADLATQFLNVQTTVNGRVCEAPRPDGAADVIVFLQTEGALTWVSQDCSNLESMIFGARVSEVVKKKPGRVHKKPALVFGTSDMQMILINRAPGAPLPDLFQAVLLPTESSSASIIIHRASAQGELRVPFNGLPEGTLVELQVLSNQDYTHGGVTRVTLTPVGP